MVINAVSPTAPLPRLIQTAQRQSPIWLPDGSLLARGKGAGPILLRQFDSAGLLAEGLSFTRHQRPCAILYRSTMVAILLLNTVG